MYGIEVAESGTTVGLRGEFDVFSLPELRRALDAAACTPGGPVTVDLSGVTFLDLGSTLELAVRALIQGHKLSFENPSPCVLASLDALGIPADREEPRILSET